MKHLKVPEGIIKAANKAGKLSYLRHWYILKSKSIDGFFYREEAIACLGMGNHAYKTINSLVKEGWLRVENGGFQLISYDALFASLGFDMTLKRTATTIRRGNFKIFLIKTLEIKNWFERVVYEEIKLNFQRQGYRIRQKLKQKRSALDIIFNVCLSNRSISNILGYSSSSTGHKILNDLAKLRLVSIHRNVDENGLPLCNTIYLS